MLTRHACVYGSDLADIEADSLNRGTAATATPQLRPSAASELG